MNDKFATKEIAKLRFEYGAYLKVIRYAKAGAENGSRGVLLGEKANSGATVQIALEALYSGDEGLEAPSFTKESWARITNEIQQYYPNMKILGQYSTHFGTEVSQQDLVLQKAFFGDFNSYLFVFDPSDNKEAIYEYKNDKFEKLEGVSLYDACGHDVDLKQKESLCRSVDTEYQYRIRAFERFSKRLNTQNTIYAAVSVILAMLLVYTLFQNMELKKRVDLTSGLETRVNEKIEQFDEIQKRIQSEVDNLAAKKSSTSSNSPKVTPKPSATPKSSIKPSATIKPTTSPNR